jgi:hypothetical protein
MISALVQEGNNSSIVGALAEFTQIAHDFRNENNFNCRPEFAALYSELGSTYQSVFDVIQFTSVMDRNFLVTLANGNLGSILYDPDALKQLQICSPVLYQAYSNLKGGSEENSFQHLIGHLINKFNKWSHLDSEEDWYKVVEELESTDEEHYIFGGTKKIRTIPKFIQSKKSLAAEAKTGNDCNKKEKRFCKMLGSFITCCEHGYINTWMLMQQKESPRYLFYLLLTRYDKCPKNVVRITGIN